MGETSKALALDRCKLCGGEAQYWAGSRRILCSKCGIQTPPVDCLAKAIVIWNRSAARRPEQEPTDMVLIPREPTDEIEAAMRDAFTERTGFGARKAYAAITALYAAPQAGKASEPNTTLTESEAALIDYLTGCVRAFPSDREPDDTPAASVLTVAQACDLRDAVRNLSRERYWRQWERSASTLASPAPAAPTDWVDRSYDDGDPDGAPPAFMVAEPAAPKVEEPEVKPDYFAGERSRRDPTEFEG